MKHRFSNNKELSWGRLSVTIFTLIILVLSNVFSSFVVGLISISVISLMFLLAPISEKFFLIFFYIPFAKTFEIPGTPNFFPVFIILLTIMLCMHKPKFKINIFIPILLLVALGLFHFRIDEAYKISIWISSLVLSLFLLGKYGNNDDTVEINSAILALGMGLTISSLLALSSKEVALFAARGEGMDNLVTQIDYIDYRFRGLFGNAGTFAFFSASVSSLLFCSSKNTNNKNRIIRILTGYVLLALGYLTFSRVYFIASILLLLQGLFSLYSKETKTNIFSFSLLLGSLFLCFLFMKYNGLIDNISSVYEIRFLSGDFFGGRIDLLRDYLSIIPNSGFRILWGFGVDNTYYIKMNMEYLAHNMYLDWYLSVGLIGLLLGFILIRGILLLRGGNGFSFGSFIPLTILFLFSFSIGIVGSDVMIFLVVLILLNLTKQKGKEGLIPNLRNLADQHFS